MQGNDQKDREKKMTYFDIYCDSGANIPYQIVKERNINVIPYSFTINGVEQTCYTEGEFKDIAKKFYDEVRAGADVKTSLITTQNFVDAVIPSLEKGKDVLITCISSGISGTYNQAKEAAKELMKAYPERKVAVCDTSNASMGEGLQVLKACDLRDMGQSVDACADWIEQNRYNINSYLTVDDLKYLKKSGRISAAAAVAGALLNIKPVLKADGGENAKIVSHSKVHGRKKAIYALAENFAANVVEPENQTVAICHADSEEDALMLADLIRQKGAKDIIIEWYDLCTGSHVGPGTVALFFYGNDRKTGVKPKEGILDRFKKLLKRKAEKNDY